MTSWEKGPAPGVSRGWSPWMTTLEKSTGFVRVDYKDQKRVQTDGLPVDVQEYIEECMPYYSEMSKDCIKVFP